jgi:hypothetical protein
MPNFGLDVETSVGGDLNLREAGVWAVSCVGLVGVLARKSKSAYWVS